MMEPTIKAGTVLLQGAEFPLITVKQILNKGVECVNSQGTVMTLSFHAVEKML